MWLLPKPALPLMLGFSLFYSLYSNETVNTQSVKRPSTLSEEDKERLKVMFLAPATETKLDISLIGTIYDGNPFKGVALLKDNKSRKIKAFRVGDVGFFDLKVLEVHRKKMVFQLKEALYYVTHSGKGEDTSKPKATPANDTYREEGFERNGTQIEVTSAFRNNLIDNKLREVLYQAEAAPYLKNGEIAGFQILQIDEGSIFQKLGLKDGDVISHINDQPLNNIAQTIQFLNGLKEATDLNIKLKRNDQPIEMSVKVK